MTWISYKRDGKFFAKWRGRPLTEMELTFEQFQHVQANDELPPEIVKESKHGAEKDGRKVVSQTSGRAGHNPRHSKTAVQHLEEREDEG